MKESDNTIFFDVFISFGNRESKTEAFANIRPNSRLESNDAVALIKEGYKKVQVAIKTFNVTYGLVSDREIVENIKKYVSMSFQERIKNIFKFLVAKGKNPVHGSDSVLIKHIELKKTKHGKIDEKTGKVNHRDLGFSERIVPKDTKIITLVKPTQGENGIDVRGEIIKAKPGKFIHHVKFSNNSIEKIENEKEIIFLSKKEGFLYEDPVKGFFIDEKVLVQSIDFNIGNIEGKSVEDSSVVVTGKSDVFDTAVKPGFKVEAKNVKIKGNVGNGAVVKGDFISINGVADKNSEISGKIVKIEKSFNNFVKGEQISIKSSNTCEVIGEIIFISNSISGVLKGSEITILNECRGTSFATDKFIFINNVTGTSKQEIIIDPLFSEKKREEFNELLEENKKLNDETLEIKTELESLKEQFNLLSGRIDNIISKYFNFNGSKAQEQKNLIKSLILKGELDFLEKKFNPDFASHDSDMMKKISKIHNELNNKKKALDDKEKSLSLNDNVIKNIKNAVKRIKIVILNIERGATIDVKTEIRKVTLSDSLEFPLIVHFSKNGIPNVQSLNDYTRARLKEELEKLISETTFKSLKTLRII